MAKNNDNPQIRLTLVEVVVLIALASIPLSNWLSVRTQRVVVTKMERTTGTAFVWTNAGTMRVGDDLLQGKLAATDTYGEMEVGKTYDVKINGSRILFPVIPQYPNILEVTPITYQSTPQ